MNDSYGCGLLTLEEDITDQFDCDYSYYLQEPVITKAGYIRLKALTILRGRPRMQVVGLAERRDRGDGFHSWGLFPEFICFYKGLLYYSDAAGQLFSFSLYDFFKITVR